MSEQYLVEVSDSELVELISGKRPELQVAVLPHEAREHFRCSRDTVYLSYQSARHIIMKHGDSISNTELKLLPRILFQGVWLADKDRPTHAVVSCEVGSRRLKAVVKVTEDRRRTYVKTLHLTAPRQTRSMFRRGNLLRPAW